MKIFVFEDNLLWSSRLVKTLRAFCHEPAVKVALPDDVAGYQIAIVNLGSPKIDASSLVPQLKSHGIHVIGHAGHKEKEVLELGRQAGCDTIATNSELTFKIEAMLDRIIENFPKT